MYKIKILFLDDRGTHHVTCETYQVTEGTLVVVNGTYNYDGIQPGSRTAEFPFTRRVYPLTSIWYMDHVTNES